MVDVRANVRLATLYFLEKFPVSRLICVEPEPRNVRLLHANLHATTVVGVPLTLAAADGLATINPTYGPIILAPAAIPELPNQQPFRSLHCYNRSI